MNTIFEALQNSPYIWYGTLTLLPILGWLYMFQRKNPEKNIYVLLTFLAGMLSVVPIKLYERYWDTALFYFEHINLFDYLADLTDLPSLSTFLAYVSINALVGVGLFLFTAILMFFLEIFTKDNSPGLFQRKVRRAAESPLFFIAIGILCGIIAYFTSFSLHQKIWFFVIVGMLEEFIKHLVLRFADEEKIKSVDDAIAFSIIVALGFAFIENILYFQDFVAHTSSDLQQISIFFILRSTVSVMAHVCFSAILGYFYGVARFSKDFYVEEQAQNRHPILHRLHCILHLKGSTLFHEEKMMEGMLLAMVTHAVFNSLLEFGKVHLLIPFLLILFFLVINLFHRKKLHIQNGTVTQTQPLPLRPSVPTDIPVTAPSFGK